MKHFISIFFLLINFTLRAQYQVGVSSSNYAGAKSMYLNPSSIADSRFKFNLYLGGFNQNITNNFVKWSAPYPFYTLFAVGIPFIPNSIKTKLAPSRIKIDPATNKAKLKINPILDGTGDFDYTGFASTGNNIKGNFGIDVDLLAFQADIEKIKATLGVSMRVRTLLDFRNNSLVATQLFAGTDNPVLPVNTDFLNQSINLKISSFHETGLTFAKSIFNNGQSSLKGGITLKYYKGIFHMGIQAENAVISLSKTNTTLSDGNVKSVNQINVPKADFVSMKATSDATLTPLRQSLIDKPYSILNPFWHIFKNRTPGRGIGGNLGFTYEFLDPDLDFSSKRMKGIEKTQNKYIFKLGVSLNDIGRIKYGYKAKSLEESKQFEVTNLNNSTNSIPLNVYELPKLKLGGNPNTATSGFIDKWFGFSAASFADSLNFGFNVGLPTSLVINVDYKLMNKVYIGGMLVQNVSFVTQNYAQPAASIIAVLPRFETKFFDATLPILLTNNYSNFQMGLGFRAGPVFFGTDHLFSFLNLTKTKGADIYMGATVPIFYKSEKKSVYDVGIYDDRTFMEKLRNKLRKRHLKKLHRKEMKRG